MKEAAYNDTMALYEKFGKLEKEIQMQQETRLILPENYDAKLNIRQTEEAIKLIKDRFERELAAVLNAEVGCSRPIAEGENWMERERYIGVSGVLLKSDLYLTLGISGQIQHMVGGNGAKVIVAINKDKNAPIFNYADYGLVGDIYKVVPALISQLSR